MNNKSIINYIEKNKNYFYYILKNNTNFNEAFDKYKNGINNNVCFCIGKYEEIEFELGFKEIVEMMKFAKSSALKNGIIISKNSFIFGIDIHDEYKFYPDDDSLEYFNKYAPEFKFGINICRSYITTNSIELLFCLDYYGSSIYLLGYYWKRLVLIAVTNVIKLSYKTVLKIIDYIICQYSIENKHSFSTYKILTNYNEIKKGSNVENFYEIISTCYSLYARSQNDYFDDDYRFLELYKILEHLQSFYKKGKDSFKSLLLKTTYKEWINLIPIKMKGKKEYIELKKEFDENKILKESSRDKLFNFVFNIFFQSRNGICHNSVNYKKKEFECTNYKELVILADCIVKQILFLNKEKFEVYKK
ncbi:MAG: hypothetical protein WCR97_01885 [Bacilli bacterium]